MTIFDYNITFDYTITFLGFYDIWMLGTVLICCFMIMDDVFIDFLALIGKVKPHKLTAAEEEALHTLPEKRIAIMMANWHEDQVLEHMVAGNVGNINYRNYQFLIGVYPNDLPTLEAARRAEARFPETVKVIVNSKNGPTSKGQLINLMAQFIQDHNTTPGNIPYDIIAIHDAEDVIHPESLKLINLRAENNDFIQVAVFSLPIPTHYFTAGVYIDEFVESHTKDILVRQFLGAGIPAAGVGTVVTKEVLTKLLELQNGSFLREKNLTEDYYLGLTCHDLGMRSRFCCEQLSSGEYIATREYFPQKPKQSIRQKTRWILGISLQGFAERKFKRGAFFENYFLWRDRKGLLNAPIYTSSFLLTIYFLATFLLTGDWPELKGGEYTHYFYILIWINLLYSVFRILYRMFLVSRVYGKAMALPVPIRWMLSNYINVMATYNAMYQFVRSKVMGKAPSWAKTDHIIPAGFGVQKKT